ncbi:hypothetical protein PACTADRAFT_5000 [Pachysolen tannophilus NRRL Y-2460]|uniref:Thymidylate kinase n=1 Tax=Pachysolen tannophilus NRRL Y-2460 TaxID=669874 RepID=A0A1E4TN80_PACTA|nr:hypothetical protein PACTADRAFT_5000 [Pachysolen tannophilus NRRL Y-2460]
MEETNYKKRGALILIEGLDRTGKTTQTIALMNKLLNEKIQANLIKFPDRSTPIGKLINTYLIDKETQLSDESAHLLFSANRWELKDKIINNLQEGKIIILDRYVYSGVAYSSAKGLDFNWCLNADLGLPKPDKTIFLNLENDQDLINRKGYGEERYEVKNFQDKVKLKFTRFFNDKNWEIIKVDNKTIDQISLEIWIKIKDLINGIEKPIEFF